MMGGRGLIPCKFGVQCHRQDCWYAHPDGRIVDAGGLAGAGALARGGMIRPALAQPVFGVSEVPSGLIPRMDTGSGCGGGSGACITGGNECRYSFDCKRMDCHFKHPFGRAIDVDGVVGSPFGRPGLQRAPSNNSICSLSRGMSEVSFGSYAPSDATDEEQALRDTWFPQARNCSCCKGYMYGCTASICEAMGMCTCSIEEKDLDGGGPPMLPGVGEEMPLAPYARVNGSSTAHAMPLAVPQPPTEAALAALGSCTIARAAPPVSLGMGNRANSNVGGGGGGGNRRGEGFGKGGAADCRYGTGCIRSDCSYRHPQGVHQYSTTRVREGMRRGVRNMTAHQTRLSSLGNGRQPPTPGRDTTDTVRVSFGDFDVLHTSADRDFRGSGNGSAHGRMRPVDQDLMDTWYPDCRNCPCCKGYKHGCQTAACAKAGICQCVSGASANDGAAIGGGSYNHSSEGTQTSGVTRDDAVVAKALAPKEGTEVTKPVQTESTVKEDAEASGSGCGGRSGTRDAPDHAAATAVSTAGVGPTETKPVAVDASEMDEGAFHVSSARESGDGTVGTTSTAPTVSENAALSA